MKEPDELSPLRPLLLLLMFVFTIKDLKSFVVCTFLLPLSHPNSWNHLSSLIGYLLWMSWLMNGVLLKDQMHYGKVIGMRHLIPIIDLSFIKTQLMYKSHRCLQCLLKSTQFQNELDTIYEGLKERPR